MAKRGRKKLPKLDLEGQNKLFKELNGVLKNNLGKRKKYVCIIAYEGEYETPQEAKAQAQVFSNLDESASLTAWKLLINGLVGHIQNLMKRYDLSSGVQQQGFSDPQPPTAPQQPQKPS